MRPGGTRAEAPAAPAAGWQWAAGARSHQLMVAGEQIHVVEAGEGPAIVLVHGLLSNVSCWRQVVPELARGHRVLAVDLVGFGLSTRSPRRPLTLGGHADRVAQATAMLGVDRMAVAGHSLGGAIAQRLALQFPERVDSLALLASLDAGNSPIWGAAGTRARRAARQARIPLAIPPLARCLTRAALRRLATEPGTVTPERVRAYCDPLIRPGTRAAFLRLFDDAEAEPPAEISRISARTLVFSGAQDTSVPPATGASIAARIPSSRHVILEAAGHLLTEEHPREVLSVLVPWLRGEDSGVVGGALARGAQSRTGKDPFGLKRIDCERGDSVPAP